MSDLLILTYSSGCTYYFKKAQNSIHFPGAQSEGPMYQNFKVMLAGSRLGDGECWRVAQSILPRAAQSSRGWTPSPGAEHPCGAVGWCLGRGALEVGPGSGGMRRPVAGAGMRFLRVRLGRRLLALPPALRKHPLLDLVLRVAAPSGLRLPRWGRNCRLGGEGGRDVREGEGRGQRAGLRRVSEGSFGARWTRAREAPAGSLLPNWLVAWLPVLQPGGLMGARKVNAKEPLTQKVFLPSAGRLWKLRTEGCSVMCCQNNLCTHLASRWASANARRQSPVAGNWWGGRSPVSKGSMPLCCLL